MRKIMLIVLAIACSTGSMAQKSLVRSAKNYIGSEQFEKAEEAINKAVKSEYSKDDPYAWYVRGVVYLTLDQQEENKGKRLYNEAGKSFLKAIELDPDYEKRDINNKIFAIAIYNFNAGLADYEQKKYDQAVADFSEVQRLRNIGDGKRFAGNDWLKFDTMATQAGAYAGYSAYYNDKYDIALPFLLAAKDNPITQDDAVYIMLADIYESKNQTEPLMKILAEAKQTFPNDSRFINRELNYYIRTDQSDILVERLQEAIQADPNNDKLLFTLAVAYDNMANPKTDQGKELPRPENYDALFAQAEEAYKKVLTLAEKPDYTYNLGALYYNRAVMVNDEMNAITGTSSAELKKYEELKTIRDQWFDQSLPYLNKTISLLDNNPKSLLPEDKNTYISALIAAKEIYAKQNNLEKATELKNKLETVTQ